MYLKQQNDVTNAALPSRITCSTHRISVFLEVNGAAADASASDKDNPTSADFNAPQSFVPQIK